MRTHPRTHTPARGPLGATIAAALLAARALCAQAPDYARADRIRTFDPLLVGGRVSPVWLDDGTRFYYETTGSGADRGTRYLVDPRARTRQPLLDTARVVSAAQRRATGPAWAARSPDGQWDAFVWNYNVYVRPAGLTNADASAWQPEPRPGFRLGCDAPAIAGRAPARDSTPLPNGSVAITTDGTEAWGYGVYYFGLEVGHLDASRYRPAAAGLRWSPDSKRLVVRRDDLRGVRVYPLYSSTSNQPIDHRYFYAAPGDSVFPRYQFVVLDPARRTATAVQHAPIGLLNSPGDARWGQTSDRLYVVSSSRGSKSVTLSAVDPTTGTPRRIAGDSAATWVEFGTSSWAVVNGGEDILWLSERDGWAHLYRYAPNGTLKNQVTRGAFVVAGIARVDSVARHVYFTAYGRAPGVPYYAHLYRVAFDGSGLTDLTPEAGNHIVRFAPAAPYFLDTRETIDSAPVTTLRAAADGRVLMELARGDVTPLRATGWTPAEVFTVKARDGATDLWGIIHRPSDFDPRRSYPIVTNVYPGPQTGSVREWVFKGGDSRNGTQPPSEGSGSSRPPYYSGDGMNRALAELGFVVIQLDALGTARRSKQFNDFLYGRVADNGLPDQIAAMRQLAARYPWIDTTRVGIWGHSGGGYSAAAAMLHHPDFFKVGVAQSGNHDFRVYGWYWGEKYQGLYTPSGTPLGASDNYEAEANYKYAANLKGKLLLMSGDMDCNNPPAETLRLVDALIKAGKDFDMLLVPDHGHQLPPYAVKRSWDYFVRHLLGVEPPSYRMIAP